MKSKITLKVQINIAFIILSTAKLLEVMHGIGLI